MAKPSTVVSWDATGHIVEPSAGKKTQGWLPGDQPPAEFMNWLFNFLGQWTSYLNGLESTEALTWALSQIFNKAITLGASFAASEAEAVSPRLIVEPVSSSTADHTCVAKFKDARLWSAGLGSNSAFSLTVNADRTTDGTDKWSKITASQPAFILQVSRDGLSAAYMPTAQNTNWTDAFLEGEGTSSGWGRLFFLHSVQGTETDGEQDIGLFNQVANGTSERKLLWTIKTAANKPIRLYYVRSGGVVGGGPGFQVSINCSYGNASNLWTHDVTGTCGLYYFGSDDFVTFTKPQAAAGTTFADTVSSVTWIVPFMVQHPTSTSGATNHTEAKLDNGHIAVTNTGSADVDDANPPATTAQANRIGVRNVDKVTAYAITNGSGGVTLQSGYNMTSVTIGSDAFTFNFNTDLADANYETTATAEIDDNTALYNPVLFNKGVGSIQCRIMKQIGAATSVVDLDTVPIGINLRVTGKQTT